MKKLIALLSIIFLFCLTFPLTQSQGSITIYDSPSDGYQVSSIQMMHPSSNSSKSAIATSFVAQQTAYLTAVNVKMCEAYTMDPDNGLMAVLGGITGSISSHTAYPNATVYATSEQITIGSIPHSPTYVTFTFNGTYQIQQGSSYSITVKGTGSDSWYSYLDTGIIIQGHMDSSSLSSSNSSGSLYHTSGWHPDLVSGIWYYYMAIEVYGTATGGETTPTPEPNPDDPPLELTEIWSLVNNLIQLIIPLLVILLPAFFGYKFAGAWGFLAGINVGAILAYVILGATTFPLWGIVAILILDALLLFGKVGFRT